MSPVISQQFGYWSKPRSTKSHGCIDKSQTVELHLSPPPGLELPQGLKPPPDLEHKVKNSLQDKEPKYAPFPDFGNMQAPFTLEPVQFKVLLQNVPEMLLKECLLLAMFEQVNLKGVEDLTFRPNGRVLVTLSSLDSMNKCIRDFNGRRWACSEKPVNAFQVRTVSRAQTDSVPPSIVPTMVKTETRDRILSSASTCSGGDSLADDASVSDDCSSEKDLSINFQ